jgi:hypothetical protein
LLTKKLRRLCSCYVLRPDLGARQGNWRTDAEWQAARKVPRAKTVRRSLGLTQEEFAERFQIPIGRLRDWRRGRVEPDPAAQAYLRAIVGDATAMQRALEVGPRAR